MVNRGRGSRLVIDQTSDEKTMVMNERGLLMNEKERSRKSRLQTRLEKLKIGSESE